MPEPLGGGTGSQSESKPSKEFALKPKESLKTSKLMKIIMIQKLVRSFLAKKRANLQYEKKQMRGVKGVKDLVLYEQSLMRLCSLYFTQFVYIDKANTEVRYTLRENSKKITIVKLYRLSKDMFDVSDVDLDDIIGAVE
mmetsp:Transcript_631/g.686  ORF Transcript_631/g.686 Transcript_631/m.686 type:complete len:139 (+) Transcript_631:2651-3067(+)